MRPLLRPGTHVLRRAGAELQVGLDPRQAVVLPATDDVRLTLALLGRSAERSEHPDPATLDLLDDSGLLVDAAAALPLMPAERAPDGLSRHDVAALVRSAGDRSPGLLRARTAPAVHPVTFGGEVGARLGERLTGLLSEAGLRVRRTPPPGGSPAARDGLGVLVGVGEPQREQADAWMRRGMPHMVVRMSEGAATVGPFVVPGRTACLRCVDAHATDADPSWPLLVTQYASRAGEDRRDGVPEPVDVLLASVALAWAARDLASYAEGRRPGTWSATVRFDPHLTAIETQPWLRHPECGCSWE